MMSAALSEQGKTRFPRSVFSGTPRPSKNAFTASGGKRVTALVRNRLLRGTFCSTSGAAQSLVTLQRPFPVM